MKDETILQNQIQVRFSELGCIPCRRNVGLFYTQNLVPIRIGTVGEPDLEIICPNGKVLFLEVKTLTGKAKIDQERYHKELRKLGHLVFMVRSVEEAENIYYKYCR